MHPECAEIRRILFRFQFRIRLLMNVSSPHEPPPCIKWLLCLALLIFFQVVVLAQPVGTIVGWGDNSSLQLQAPPGLNGVVATAAGSAHSLALKNDGTVVGWGLNVSSQATPPADLSGVIAIQAGLAYSMALKSDGSVVAWGDSSLTPPILTNALAIAAGWTHSLALLADGTVTSWASDSKVPPEATNVISLSAGNGQSLALRSDGTVLAWGDNSFGKATVPATVTNVAMIAAGGDHN